MNSETLQKANKLKIEIEDKTKMINALEAPYANCIRAVNFWGEKETTAIYTFERNSELYNLILNHFKKELLELQSEFEAL